MALPVRVVKAFPGSPVPSPGQTGTYRGTLRTGARQGMVGAAAGGYGRPVSAQRRGCGGRPARCAVACAAGAALALSGAGQAAAHSTLVASEPRSGAVLDVAPGTIRLVFDAPVGPRYGAVTVTGPDGVARQTGRVAVAGAVATQPVGPLTAGRYRVSYRLTSAGDDHPVVGALHFDVGAGARPAVEPPVGAALGPGLALLVVGVVATGAGWCGRRRAAGVAAARGGGAGAGDQAAAAGLLPVAGRPTAGARGPSRVRR